MVYGIFSQLDDTATKAFFKSKKIPDLNVIYITQIPSLVQMLKTGDAVYAVSVNRFTTVSQFFQFGKFCMSRGGNLQGGSFALLLPLGYGLVASATLPSTNVYYFHCGVKIKIWAFYGFGD